MRRQVDYWEKWGGAEWDAAAALVAAFNDSQGEFAVVMTEAGDWSASPDLPRFLKAHSEGRAPDVVGLEDHHIPTLAADGRLVPLELETAGYDKRVKGLGVYETTVYGLPLAADLVTLYINLAAFEGMDHGPIFSDLKEFDAALDELWGHGKIGFVPTYPGWFPQAWPMLLGGSWFAPDGAFTPDDPANVAAFDWVVSLRRRFDLDDFADPVNPALASDRDPFVVGDVAMVLDGDWLVRGLLAQPGLKWRCAPFPAAQGPAALVVADVLALPTGARCPEGAAAFLRFAATQERVERLALAQSKISPLATWSSEFLATHPNPEIRTLRAMFDGARLLHGPRIPGWLGYLERIKHAFAAMWSLKLSPSEALDGIR